MNRKILGLDIGTNSIGWALIEENAQLIKMGVRIFPIGLQEDSYNKSGKEVSKNVARRTARGARRAYHRYTLRRKQLRAILLANSMLPQEANIEHSPISIYQLRHQAISQQVSLPELGRIFLHLNQRRGFKSSRKDLQKAAKETGIVKEQIKELALAIQASGCQTLGSYFYHLIQENQQDPDCFNPQAVAPTERIRKRYVSRLMYEQEFDKIWEAQQPFYPNILTGNAHEKNNKSLYHRLKNRCIFYQRPLKSQKSRVARCRFEPQKRCMPVAALLYQEFRIWQKLADLRIIRAGNAGAPLFGEAASPSGSFPLSLEQKQLLANYLQVNPKITAAQIGKLLKLAKHEQLNKIEEIKGNTTYKKITDALGQAFWDSLPAQQQHRIWHTLYFATTDEWLRDYAQKKWGFSTAQADNLCQISLEPDHGSISHKALQGILAHMKLGMDYTEACAACGYHHSFDDLEDGKDRPITDLLEPLQNNELRNPIVQQAVSETIRLVNRIIKNFGKPDEVRIEMAREMKWTKEKRENYSREIKAKNQQREHYATILSDFLGREISPDRHKNLITKYELWLELGMAQGEESAEDTKEFQKFTKELPKNMSEKYRLWLEAKRRSPYTGKPISLQELLSPTSEIEIEHIIPYSKSMDDSFMNKTLCERSENGFKNNRLPYQYFQAKRNQSGWNWESFVRYSSIFPEAKRKKMLMEEIPSDFLNSQITNTAYIAKEVVKVMKKAFPKVGITNGQVTAQIRRIWGLNTILNANGEDKKERGDHRHHAIDALVIACTSMSIVKKFADNVERRNGKPYITQEHLPLPWPCFRGEIETAAAGILISFRNKKRLVNTRRNTPKKHETPQTQAAHKPSISIRGTLHEETLYGQIIHPKKRTHTKVVRKSIESLVSSSNIAKTLEAVIDPVVRKILQDRLAAFGGNVKKAFGNLEEDPIFMHSTKGKKVPIKKVRLEIVSNTMVEIRPQVFVETGNNYAIGLYENATTGKRQYITHSFFKAAQKRINREVFWPKAVTDEKGNIYTFMFWLTHNDLVVTYQNHPDEIEWDNPQYLFEHLYRIVKFDANGRITLDKHYFAKKQDKGQDAPISPTYGSFKGIKVQIDETGQIIKKFI